MRKLKLFNWFLSLFSNMEIKKYERCVPRMENHYTVHIGLGERGVFASPISAFAWAVRKRLLSN